MRHLISGDDCAIAGEATEASEVIEAGEAVGAAEAVGGAAAAVAAPEVAIPLAVGGAVVHHVRNRRDGGSHANRRSSDSPRSNADANVDTNGDRPDTTLTRPTPAEPPQAQEVPSIARPRRAPDRNDEPPPDDPDRSPQSYADRVVRSDDGQAQQSQGAPSEFRTPPRRGKSPRLED